MRRFAVAFLAMASLRAEIVDRIAVTVGDRVITESMVTLQMRLAAFQDDREPDLSPQARRAAADTLISQILLLQEMDDARYPDPPMADVLVQIQKIMRDRSWNEERFRQALAASRLEEQEFQRFLQQQMRAIQFIDIRFRTGAQVTSDEIAEHYERTFKADWLKRGSQAPVPPLEDVASDIEELLAGRKVDAATEDWLRQARSRARIRYREEVFR